LYLFEVVLLSGKYGMTLDRSCSINSLTSRVNDGVINRTMTYGPGNREATVSGGIAPLGYDYKGNVITRQTLDGTRMWQCEQTS